MDSHAYSSPEVVREVCATMEVDEAEDFTRWPADTQPSDIVRMALDETGHVETEDAIVPLDALMIPEHDASLDAAKDNGEEHAQSSEPQPPIDDSQPLSDGLLDTDLRRSIRHDLRALINSRLDGLPRSRTYLLHEPEETAIVTHTSAGQCLPMVPLPLGISSRLLFRQTAGTNIKIRDVLLRAAEVAQILVVETPNCSRSIIEPFLEELHLRGRFQGDNALTVIGAQL